MSLLRQLAVSERKACGIENDQDYSCSKHDLLHDFKAAAQTRSNDNLCRFGMVCKPVIYIVIRTMLLLTQLCLFVFILGITFFIFVAV